MSSWLTQYLVAAAAFCLIDFLWLGTVAKQIYQDRMGHLLAEKPNVAAAVVFYAIFVAGLVYFVIHPAVDAESWSRALVVGAFFGLVTYATWDLTNLSVLKDFPLSIVPIDMAWGTFLAASVSSVTYAVVQLLPAWAR
ncbi:MAG: DUF2177 family protein [Nocardioides sp.]